MITKIDRKFYFDPNNAPQGDIFILMVLGGGEVYRNNDGIIFTKNINNFKNVRIITNLQGWYLIEK